MTESWQNDLNALRTGFLHAGPGRVRALRDALSAFERDRDPSHLDELRRQFHRLGGAGGTYGCRHLSELGREGERLCQHVGVESAGTADTLEALADVVDQIDAGFTAEIATLDAGPVTGAVAIADPGGHDVSPRSASAADPATRRTRPPAVERWPHNPSDILVIDDDPETVAMLTTLLSQQEWTVRTASTCTAARREIGFHMPAGLIVDILLPDGQGYDIVRHVRSLPHGDRPAIVVISRLSEFLDQAEAIQSGADACFEKPLDLEAMIQKLHHLLERHDPWLNRVLVVEDDEGFAAFVRTVLEGAGYTVAVCAQPKLFAEELSGFRPDVLVMDIGLPDLNGYDLARYVRQLDQFATVPIVFLTGENGVDARIRTVRAGADDYLVKPVHPSLLVASVAARLERARFFRTLLNKDGLTRLLTHTCFIEEAQALVDRKRRDDSTPATLAMLDLDHFKTINDTYGHQAGDRVLVALSGLLRRHLRRSDIVGRYGGEEFGVLLDHIGAADAANLLERLLSEFSALEHRSPDGLRFTVTFSAGVAELEAEAMDVEQWIRAADAALYRAKGAGRRQVCRHDGSLLPTPLPNAS
ncbi:MAG: diguanylate cyclase [Vicinamibacterales bacterium]